jgi:hypothetical protein
MTGTWFKKPLLPAWYPCLTEFSLPNEYSSRMQQEMGRPRSIIRQGLESKVATMNSVLVRYKVLKQSCYTARHGSGCFHGRKATERDGKETANEREEISKGSEPGGQNRGGLGA